MTLATPSCSRSPTRLEKDLEEVGVGHTGEQHMGDMVVEKGPGVVSSPPPDDLAVVLEDGDELEVAGAKGCCVLGSLVSGAELAVSSSNRRSGLAARRSCWIRSPTRRISASIRPTNMGRSSSLTFTTDEKHHRIHLELTDVGGSCLDAAVLDRIWFPLQEREEIEGLWHIESWFRSHRLPRGSSAPPCWHGCG